MNRDQLENELKRVHVSLDGWLPVLKCDNCGKRWEPFAAAVGDKDATARFDYWVCPNQCNAKEKLSPAAMLAVPKHVVINDVHGMVFGEEDMQDFERYVRSMDATEVWNRPFA
jgi:hypothetical protein